jgi:hypothetical protein
MRLFGQELKIGGFHEDGFTWVPGGVLNRRDSESLGVRD